MKGDPRSRANRGLVMKGTDGITAEVLNFTSKPELALYLANYVNEYGPTEDYARMQRGEFKAGEQDAVIAEVRHMLSGGSLLMNAMEGINVTFTVSGMSRTCTHQFVRSRVGWSYLHRGSRDHDESDFNYRQPETYDRYLSPADVRRFHDIVASANAWYKNAIASGVPLQDARFVFPQAIDNTIWCSVSYLALVNFCEKRMMAGNQWEINTVSRVMADAVERAMGKEWAAPLRPRCEKVGRCLNPGPIFPPCGKMPWTKKQQDAKYLHTRQQNTNRQYVESDRARMVAEGKGHMLNDPQAVSAPSAWDQPSRVWSEVLAEQGPEGQGA